jgi:hypothetical protein
MAGIRAREAHRRRRPSLPVYFFWRQNTVASIQKGKDCRALVPLQLVADEMAAEVGECARHHVHSHEDGIDRGAHIDTFRCLEDVPHHDPIQHEVAELKIPI